MQQGEKRINPVVTTGLPDGQAKIVNVFQVREPAVVAEARSADTRFLDPLASFVEERAGQLATDEASHIGRVLGILGGPESIPRWQAWLQPAAGRRKGFEGPLARVVAAATALAFIRAEAAAEALGAAFDDADETSQPWILGALAQRQRQTWEGTG